MHRALSLIARVTPDMLYIYDLQSERTVFSNGRIGEFLGWTQAEMDASGGQIAENAMHPDDVPRFRECLKLFDTLPEGDVQWIVYRMRHKDGSYRWLHSRDMVFTRDDDGRPQLTIGFARDITTQVDKIESLRQEQSNLHLAMDAARIFTWDLNLQTQEIALSDNTSRVMGFEVPANLPEALLFVHEDDRPAITRQIQQALESQSNFEAECRYVHPDTNQIIWVRSQGKLLRDENNEVQRFFGINQNVTEQVNNELRFRVLSDELREKSQLLDNVLSSVDDHVYILSAEGRFLYANRKLNELFQHITPDVAGKDFEELQYPVELAETVRAQIREVIETRQIVRAETPFTGAEGEQEFQYVFVPFDSPDGRTDTVAGITRNVTEQKQLERALRESQANLQFALERERHITEVLQYPLIQAIPSDAFPGLEIATRYEPALQEALIGGDYHDVFALPDGRIALVVADASGKGLEAAARVMQVREVLRAFAREPDQSIHETMRRLNNYVCDTKTYEDKPDESFIALNIAILDGMSGAGHVISAGAEQPLLFRNGNVAVLECSNLPLGVLRDAVYESLEIDLGMHDTLLLYTDGITEVFPRRVGMPRVMLGIEGLMEVLRQAGDLEPLSRTADAIVDTARRFGEGVFSDDVCLLVTRCRRDS